MSIAKTLTNLAITAGRRGDLARSQSLHEQALASFEAHGHEHFSAISLVNLADLAADRDDAGEAAARYRAALQILHDLGDQQRAAFALDGLGRSCVLLGRPEQAADCGVRRRPSGPGSRRSCRPRNCRCTSRP